jgi:TrpR-related protein YerC/YecD
MAERLYAAQLLLEGKTYHQVISETSISSATLSRISQCVQYGKGYSALLKK